MRRPEYRQYLPPVFSEFSRLGRLDGVLGRSFTPTPRRAEGEWSRSRMHRLRNNRWLTKCIRALSRPHNCPHIHATLNARAPPDSSISSSTTFPTCAANVLPPCGRWQLYDS